ncbi:MAG: hypothetical protein ABSG82_01440 [Sedimentisphaerales bacterium]|jgi:hypothetical protein
MNIEHRTKNVERTTQDKQRRSSAGLSQIELVVAMAIAFIVMLTTAILVQSGYRGWNQTYNNINAESRLGALDTMTALGAIGRKSNKLDYRVYKKLASGSYQRATPLVNPEEIVTGDAVEFRYWDGDLSADFMNPDVNANSYALFYLDNGQLKINYGLDLYPPGGINEASGTIRSGTGITTTTLTKNISSVEFSHTTKNMAGDGMGCVRMKLVITDPNSGLSKTTIAATLMRNVWPQ